MNRGLARRPVFEGRRELRYFLALLARKIREGRIEVHAYALLTTHFHLLIRSPHGELSDVMMWVENQYVRWFNRCRGRDGSLFRGRFTSRVVDSEAYWFALVRYIDANAVEAGLAEVPAAYPFASSYHYALGSGPPWLSRTEIEREVIEASGTDAYEPRHYVSVFGSHASPAEAWIVERRIDRGSRFAHLDAAWDDLIGQAPERVRSMLLARIRAADGEQRAAPLMDPITALRTLEAEAAREPVWWIGAGARRRDTGWMTARVGVLSEACGLKLDEIAQRLPIDRFAAGRCLARHRQRTIIDDEYAERFARLVARALEDAFSGSRLAARVRRIRTQRGGLV